jgi:hypothetical protein
VVAVLWNSEPRMSTCLAAIWNLAVSCCEKLTSTSRGSPASPCPTLHVDDEVITGTDWELLELRASLQRHFQNPLPPQPEGESSEDQKSDSSSEPAWEGLGFPGRAQNVRSSGGTGECPPGDLTA